METRGIPVEDNFTEYRVMYLSYDIKDLLKNGENVVGAILGDGFADSPSNWVAAYGTPRFLGQIHVKYTDGTEQVITSDPSWKAAVGPLLSDTVYGGEQYDARLEKTGWNAPGFDDSTWQASFGYWVAQGATTTWEHWNGSASRNHSMFGGGFVWFYRKLAGMDADIDQPGYKHIVFRPQPVGNVTFAEYSTLTVYGKAGIRWEKKDGKMMVDVTVPVGSTATVCVPAKDANSVTESGQPIAGSRFVMFQKMEDEYAVYNVTEGKFHFVAQ